MYLWTLLKCLEQASSFSCIILSILYFCGKISKLWCFTFATILYSGASFLLFCAFVYYTCLELFFFFWFYNIITIICRYEFRLRVSLGAGGELMLTSRIRNTNTDGKPFTFTFAYHTYFAVTDIRFYNQLVFLLFFKIFFVIYLGSLPTVLGCACYRFAIFVSRVSYFYHVNSWSVKVTMLFIWSTSTQVVGKKLMK